MSLYCSNNLWKQFNNGSLKEEILKFTCSIDGNNCNYNHYCFKGGAPWNSRIICYSCALEGTSITEQYCFDLFKMGQPTFFTINFTST